MEAKPDEGVTESLRSLQSLLDDGIITEADFEAKKRQLLDQPALPTTRAAPPGETRFANRRARRRPRPKNTGTRSTTRARRPKKRETNSRLYEKSAKSFAKGRRAPRRRSNNLRANASKSSSACVRKSCARRTPRVRTSLN